MYIEFKLPSGAGGMAAGYTSQAINKKLAAWAEDYGYSYTTKYGRYRLWVVFDDPAAYTAFGISWQPWGIYSVPEIIDKRLDL